MLQIPTATKALMLSCTAFFCLQFFLPLAAWFGLWPVTSGYFQPWQIVTYAFLHGDTFHLFFNMLGLYTFGSELERFWGTRRYLQYLAAGVLSAAVTQMLLSLVMPGMGYTVGISGGIFALLLAFGMLFPNRTMMLLIPPIPMKARTFAIVFGVLELVLGLGLLDFILGSSSNVAHFAHLGGMAGGYLMILYWRGKLPGFGKRRR